MGANIDAISVASQFGIAKNRAVRYESDSVGTRLNYNVMSNLISSARMCQSSAKMTQAFNDEDFLEDIENDYEKRHK